jgi:Arc/MetJ family transcription regulator
MRTTIRLDDALLREAKKLGVETGRSLTVVIEDALREAVNRRKVVAAQSKHIRLHTFKGRGLQPGIDLDNSAELPDVMEENR